MAQRAVVASQTSGPGQGICAEQAWSIQAEQTVGAPGVASRGMQTLPELRYRQSASAPQSDPGFGRQTPFGQGPPPLP